MLFRKPNRAGRLRGETGRAVAQVKSGRWTLNDLRALIGSMHDPHNPAELGVLIVMTPPGARSQAPAVAARAGVTRIDDHDYPRVQIWPIAEYFEGRFPDLPIAIGREYRRLL